MSQRKSSFRPSLESFEQREVPTANVLGSLAAAGPALVQQQAPAVQHAAVAPSSVGFDQMTPISVISLRNNTHYNVAFQFRWSDGSWQTWTLRPGEGRFFWHTGAGHVGYVNFDSSTAAGWQGKSYYLPSHQSGMGGFADLQPQFRDGLLYSFRPTTPGHLDLYRG